MTVAVLPPNVTLPAVLPNSPPSMVTVASSSASAAEPICGMRADLLANLLASIMPFEVQRPLNWLSNVLTELLRSLASSAARTDLSMLE